MELTEKWLGEIGGWAAMKAARGLVDAGLVSVQSAEPTLIRGLAGSAKVKFSSGLRIRSRSDVDNLCTCPASRRGLVCEHSLAVALASLRASAPTAPTGKSSSSAVPVRSAPPSASAPARPGIQAGAAPSAPAVRQPRRVPGRYTVFLPESLSQGQHREPVGVYVKFEAGGDPEESVLAEWLAEQGLVAQSAPISLRGRMWIEFLTVLGGHPRVLAGKPSTGGLPVAVADTPVRLPLLAEGGEGEVTLSLAGRELPLSQARDWWWCAETATLFPVPTAPQEVAKVLEELVPIGLSSSPRTARRPLTWFVAHRSSVDQTFQVELQGETLRDFHVAPVPSSYQIHVEGSLQAVDLAIYAVFAEHRWAILDKHEKTNISGLFPIQDERNKAHFYVRDSHGESCFVARFHALGFKISEPTLGRDAPPVLRLQGAEAVLQFYASELPRLRQQAEVVEGDRWRAATRGVARVAPRIRTGTAEETRGAGGDWLAMEFGYEAPDGFRLPRAEVLRLVRSGQRSVHAKNGKRYVLDLQGVEEFEQVLQDVPLQLTGEGARVNVLHAPYLLPDGDSLLPKLPEETDILPLLGDLGPKLRPYQLLGTRWMASQVAAGRGGVLGDEMGLGKTVQSIAVIASLRQTPPARSDSQRPVLIVCPKSLVGNWRSEFERFAPQLKVAAIHGANRAAALAEMSSNDVIITTYQLVVRDLDSHSRIQWRLVLLDEASFIRNADTEASKALRSLRADSRLALTGTPVENSTRDLWSIYQFVLPGYLGSKDSFKERFELPIQTSLDTPAGQAASERLKKLIRPYFLRRTKREVLRDLPEKIEQVLWCDPSPAQAEVYRRLLEEGREEIKSARKRSGQNGAKMTMFTVLLRLRQACCDLRLTGLTADALKGLDQDDLSGKWPLLQERVDEIVNDGGKVLIFSQFVQYLRLVRTHLESQNMPFCYLDGSSQDRDLQVKTFQGDPSRKVFLISLKAGGYGLNLTAADHVILLDPWWNPAVEAQAIDRAHRMGQQRVVTAYRLAVRGTVEERILALQSKKRGLVEAALDEQSPLMAGLQVEDLEGLID